MGGARLGSSPFTGSKVSYYSDNCFFKLFIPFPVFLLLILSFFTLNWPKKWKQSLSFLKHVRHIWSGPTGPAQVGEIT